jgi:hypothetical protein
MVQSLLPELALASLVLEQRSLPQAVVQPVLPELAPASLVLETLQVGPKTLGGD